MGLRSPKSTWTKGPSTCTSRPARALVPAYGDGPAPQPPDVCLRLDVSVCTALAAGTVTLGDAVSQGLLKVSGGGELAKLLLSFLEANPRDRGQLAAEYARRPTAARAGAGHDSPTSTEQRGNSAPR